MTIEQEVALLTVAVDSVTAAVEQDTGNRQQAVSAAAASAAAAQTAEDGAKGSATAAAGSASAADQSRLDAQSARDLARGYREGAEAASNTATAQVSLAQTARTGAETARGGAETARTGSEAARDLAHDWAEKPDGQDVAGMGTRSARHYANQAANATGLASGYRDQAQASRDAAAGSASSATGSATAAATSASNAATSETNANASKVAAANSASSASDSATAAAASKAAADADAVATAADRTAAANSAAAAQTARTGSETARDAAAVSASNAATAISQSALPAVRVAAVFAGYRTQGAVEEPVQISGMIRNTQFVRDLFIGTSLTAMLAALEGAFTRASAATSESAAGVYAQVASGVPRLTDKGLQVEGAGVNDVPNSSGQGAVLGVIGSGGAAPTGWNLPTNITRQVTFIGTVRGVDVVGIRFFGTPSTTNAQILAFEPPITKVVGTLRTVSVFLSMAAGSYNNVNPVFLLRSGGEVMTGGFLPDSTLKRYEATKVLTATEGQVALRWNYNDTTTPVDFTLYFGLPNGKDWNPAVTMTGGLDSPIRSTGAATIREADFCNYPYAGLAAGTIVLSGQAALFAPTSEQVFWQWDDGTLNNRIRIVRDNARALRAIVTSGGTVQANLNLGTVADGAMFKVAFAWNTADFSASLNGAAVVTAAAGTVPPGLTTIRLGSSITDNHCWGFIRGNELSRVRHSNSKMAELIDGSHS